MCSTRPPGCCEAPSVTDARLHPSMRTLPSLLSASASAKSAQEDPTDTCATPSCLALRSRVFQDPLMQYKMQGKTCVKLNHRATPACLRRTSAEVLSASPSVPDQLGGCCHQDWMGCQSAGHDTHHGLSDIPDQVPHSYDLSRKSGIEHARDRATAEQDHGRKAKPWPADTTPQSSTHS